MPEEPGEAGTTAAKLLAGEGPVVVSIHVAKARRLPMRAVEAVRAEAGRGLVGDRYHGSRVRNVTVQSLEELEQAARVHDRAIDPGKTRRNITLSAGRLSRKPGHRFRIGEIELEVVRDAAPCKLLDDALGRDVRLALARRAGVVCRILNDGELRVGDRAELDQCPPG
ncbi:MAG: MOSC domain-containing protein [Myxococcota bacterium]